MSPKLLHIYGPLTIHSYGTAIVFGLATFLWFIRKDARLRKIVDYSVFNNLIAAGILVGIIGGRLLYIISEWDHFTLSEIFMPWIGGFSILGTVIAITVTLPLYFYYLRIPILPLFDLVGLYAPLMQAIARLGCFFAGCCYGQTSKVPWAITYKHQDSIAPNFIPLHPTQLYSSTLLFIVFLALYFIVQQRCTKPGQLMCFYFIGIGIERFVVDFWRANRIFSSISFFQILSIHQWIASGIVIVACITFAYLSQKPVHNQ